MTEAKPNHWIQGGMSLRDYFAGQAMVAFMPSVMDDFSYIAKRSYMMADAMLTERRKKRPLQKRPALAK